MSAFTSDAVLSWRQAADALKDAGYPLAIIEAHHAEAVRNSTQQKLKHQATIDFYSTYLASYPAALILDLGAGAGEVAKPLSRLPNVTSIVAYDIELSAMRPLIEAVAQHYAYQMAEASNNGSLAKISFCSNGSAWQLPFLDQSFDAVVCRYAMHHIEKPCETVQEIYRCLKPGGVFLYSDPVMPEHARDTTHGLYALKESSFHGYLTYHETIDMVTQAGLIIQGLRPYDYGRGTMDQYLKSVEHDAMKAHLIRAWCHLDAKTKQQFKWKGTVNGDFIVYPVVDLAAQKPLS